VAVLRSIHHDAGVAPAHGHRSGIAAVHDRVLPPHRAADRRTAIHSAYAAASAKVHDVASKTEMHARLAVETDAEYAAQCELIRGIFPCPFECVKTD
jgi:hypothetical protein